MVTLENHSTLYSPVSEPSGEYPATFTQSELAAIKELTTEILTDHEWVIPLIPEVIIKSSIDWYAELFLADILARARTTHEPPTLAEFQEIAKNCLVIYNLKGALQFKEAFEQTCLSKLQLLFPDLTGLESAGIHIVPVRVASASGKMAFGASARFESWPTELFHGKDIVSLDDIGDRGTTQQAIKEQALRDGAASVTTVNMVEKMVPDTVEPTKQKIAHPDVALLHVAYRYLLGWGLDDGIREDTRTYQTIVALSEEEPPVGQIAFQGSTKNE